MSASRCGLDFAKGALDMCVLQAGCVSFWRGILCISKVENASEAANRRMHGYLVPLVHE